MSRFSEIVQLIRALEKEMIFAADKVKVIAPHQAMKTSGRVQQ
jgi:hypothetical protein